MEIPSLKHFGFVVLGILAGFVLVGLWNSFAGSAIPALKAS